MKHAFAAALLSLSTLATPSTAQENGNVFNFIAADLDACYGVNLIQARLHMTTTLNTPTTKTNTLNDIQQQTRNFQAALDSAFETEIMTAKGGVDTIAITDRFIEDIAPKMLKDHFRQTDPGYTDLSSRLEWASKRFKIDADECTPGV